MSSISQKEYLKKYLSGDVKKKKKKKITGAKIKRSVIVDDDIDLKSMRPLEDDEVDLYQMDEDAPLIAGIIDERPPEVKAQEYYSSKRWKVFGGEDGVNVVDSMNNDQNAHSKFSKESKNQNFIDRSDRKGNNSPEINTDKKRTAIKSLLEKNYKVAASENNLNSHSKRSKKNNSPSDTDESPPRVQKRKPHDCKDDSDVSPPRKSSRHSSSESDISLPRRKNDKNFRDSDGSPPRRDSRKQSPKHSREYKGRRRDEIKNRNCTNSPTRRDKTNKYDKDDSNNSFLTRTKSSYKQDRSDSDTSPPRKNDKHNKYVKDLHPRREKKSYKAEADSDASPPRRSDKYSQKKSFNRVRKGYSSDSDNSPPRKESKNSQSRGRRSSRSRSPEKKSRPFHNSKKHSRDHSPNSFKTSVSERNKKRNASDSDNSPPRRRINIDKSDSDTSPPRKNSQINDRPQKKILYKPNDDSSDEGTRSKGKKMKTTLDGKQAGLQDAKQLKKELTDLKMREDNMFSNMDASVSGIGAAPVRRDRKTGQIRDLEKEEEAQKEKKAKESVVNEKYYKWGKGIKQTEDAAVRAAEMIKEMNKPLARYVDDKDLDEFLKAQDREGDPMLEYIKKKQSESTPLQGEKPIYKGSWTPNRFNIRPGYRWDGVVRSNGYEQEWFKTKNAKKARDEEAYKWSTSDM